MFDKRLVLEILQQIEWSIKTVQKRFRPIETVDDFTESDAGLEKLDAICMQLIAIGESLKNLDKVTANALLLSYPEIDWAKVKGIRDVISHHYFDIDAEIIYDVCVNQIDKLGSAIQKIIEDLT